MDEKTGRALIVNYAKYQVGAHYMPGTRGGVPDGLTVLGRPVKLYEQKKWKNLCVHAPASSLGRCYGRYDAKGLGGYMFSPSGNKLAALKEYHARHEDAPVDTWPPFEKPGLTPRRISKKDGDSIVLGEDCRGKRHFDCIGFIFWVLNCVVPHPLWDNYGIKSYARASFDLIEKIGPLPQSELLDGDIVTDGEHHIGFATATGWVVHAKWESEGVVVERYSERSTWSVTRVKSSTFG